MKDFGLTALGRTMGKTRGNEDTGTWVFFKKERTANPGECIQKLGTFSFYPIQRTFWTEIEKKDQKGDKKSKKSERG